MNEKPKLTEDSFLKARVADRRPVSCYLASGACLQGVIVSFDQEAEAIFMRSVEADDDADVIMIYKFQILSVVPDSAKISAKNGRRPRSPSVRESSRERPVGGHRLDQAQ